MELPSTVAAWQGGLFMHPDFVPLQVERNTKCCVTLVTLVFFVMKCDFVLVPGVMTLELFSAWLALQLVWLGYQPPLRRAGTPALLLVTSQGCGLCEPTPTPLARVMFTSAFKVLLLLMNLQPGLGVELLAAVTAGE